MAGEEKEKSIDYILLSTVTVLLAVGVLMVFSASSVTSLVKYHDALYFFKRQVAWVIIGLVVMLVILNIDYWYWRRLSFWALLGSIGLLALVLVPGIGTTVGGSQRWIGLGPVNLQPSELSKLAIVLFFSSRLASQGKDIERFWTGLIPNCVITAVIAGLIMLQPDLGTTLVIGAVFAVLLFAAGARISHLALLAGVAIPVVVAFIFTESYRLKRLLAFINPWAQPLGYGYHIIQSMYAIGSGGLFGLGLGNSRQKYFYLPEQHTDFIFSIISEELGFIGAACIIVLFIIFAWRGYRLAIKAPDRFSSLLAVGVTTMITMQAALNIGVVTSSIPTTGITLPFVSYGGSSLVLTLAGVAVLLNISKHVRTL